MQTERRLVPMPDGREIDVLTAGPDDGFPLVVHEGTPVGLVLNNRLAATAADRGLRVVLTARPGYEGSTARLGRRVADVAADVAAVLDALGDDTFVSIGFSGGGPHSLACAALLPGRCLAAASVAGVAPYPVDGLDFLAGMGPENIEEFSLAEQGQHALTPFLEKEAAALREITGEQIVAALGGLISGADADVLTGEFADDLAGGLRGAVREGIAGWRDDDLAFVTDWGFSLDDLAGRAAIWQGDQDRMVPFAHGQWLAAHIPSARAHLEPGAGHLTMTVTMIDRILDDLLDLAGVPRAYPG
ncbi:MAG TPA: alpha/beta fold hydrolase [Trebonia sp.]|nr:alpha/beta fold hydrolase [Trebonia sp.]